MRITRLSLHDFRNYADATIVFSDSISVLVGDNAQGKTNLLEAVVFLSTGRSHRVSDEQHCIRQGQTSAIIQAHTENASPLDLKVVLHDQGKSLFLQNQLVRKSSDFIGKLNAVLFSPGDLELFEASPRSRRRFLDTEIGKINPVYVDALSKANRFLKDRNACLKAPVVDEVMVEVLTERLVDVSVDVIRLRSAFTERLNAHLTSYYQALALSESVIGITYNGVTEFDPQTVDRLRELYRKNRERDRFLKSTSVGIHRDDLTFTLDGHPVDEWASQGQRRLIVIALKCALVAVIEEITGEKPILLLDDVFSELDASRRKALFTTLHRNTQTLISTTDLHHVSDWLHDSVTVYTVTDGHVEERNRL
jgi:DNA replication and repair protein RecF